MAPEFFLTHLSRAGAVERFDEILAVYRSVYGREQNERDIENFRARALAQFAGNGFDSVVARTTEPGPIGFTYGLRLRPGSSWWAGLEPMADLPNGFADEHGTRSFAVIELVVMEGFRGRGLGRALLEELLAGRTEERATLAVDPSKPENRSLYEGWGWSRAGRVKAGPDAPVPFFDLYWQPLTSAA